MILTDVGMIAADTSRTRAYLQSLIKYKLFPNYVLILEHNSEGLLPGQMEPSEKQKKVAPVHDINDDWSETNFNPVMPLKDLLVANSIPFEVSQETNMNDPSIAELLTKRHEAVFIYSGFGGVLLRKNVLSIGKTFLHIHGGYLPDFKGSTTNYYSLIVEDSIGASAIFLSEEIDSGPVIARRKFSFPPDLNGIDHIYDSAARAKMLIEVIQKYLLNGKWEFELSDNSVGETYYIIHPVLKHIAILQNTK
jgi:methionyl-tRNA formyltransferase